MSSQVTNYQCPNCTGPLHYDGGSGQLECDHCSSRFDVAVIEQLYADKEQAAISAGNEPQWGTSVMSGEWSDEEASRLRAYSCPSCGAELICDESTVATTCPYCANPTVVSKGLAGELKPDYVIPFKLDKNAAVDALKEYYRGKKFLPKSFASNNHIDEIKGVYVPFWLFDAETAATMRFMGTKVTKYTSGDYEVTDTDHYRVVREGNMLFEKVPVDGSSKMPDAHMDAVEPFDYASLTPFSTAYLPGYMADKYDQNAEVCSKRANERITTSTESAFAATTSGYASLTREYSNINLRRGEVKYVLMPVWMLATKWQGQDFLFAMNGQSGKLIGDLPIDKDMYRSWFAKIALGTAAVLSALLFLL